MKFGLYSSIANPPRGEHLDRCVDQVIAEAQLAEASGFDACFFGEHHQDKDGFLPSPLIVATAVAAQTRRLHVGTSVILLPLHHPVHVAEDVTTLDIISKGRVILGVGVGYQAADFQAFGVPMEHRAGLFEEEWRLFASAGVGSHFPFMARTTPWTTSRYAPDHCRLLRRPCGLAPACPPLCAGPGASAMPLWPRPAPRWRRPYAWWTSIVRRQCRPDGSPQVVLMRDAWVATSRAEAEAMYGTRSHDGLSLLLGKSGSQSSGHWLRGGVDLG